MKLADLYVEFNAKGLTRILGNMKLLHSKLSMANSGLQTMSRIAKRVFLVAGGMIALAVREAAKFESQLSMVSTMLDRTTMKYMQQYARGIRNLAMEFGEGTATLSKGLYDILSASIDPAKALEVLAVSTKSAAAGFTTTAVSADAITTIINSYGLAAEDAAMISDKLFATVKRGKLTYEELASSIGKVAATAATAGLSLDELLAAVSTITRAGIGADQAMTSMVGIIRSFLSPTAEGAKLFEKFAKEAGFLGAKLNTTTLRTHGLVKILKMLNGVTGEQIKILFPNIRGYKGVAAAIQNLTGHAFDLNMIMHSSGMTQEAFAKRQATLSFQLGRLKQSFLDLLKSLGQEFLPMIKDLADWLSKLSSGIRNNWSQIVAAVGPWIKWSLAISAAVIALKLLFGVLTAITAHPLIALGTLLAAVLLLFVDWESHLDSLKKKLSDFSDGLLSAAEHIEKLSLARETGRGEVSVGAVRVAELRGKKDKTLEEDVELEGLTKGLKSSLAPFMKNSKEAVDRLGKSAKDTEEALKEIDKAIERSMIKGWLGDILTANTALIDNKEHVKAVEDEIERLKKLTKTDSGIDGKIEAYLFGGITKADFKKRMAEETGRLGELDLEKKRLIELIRIREQYLKVAEKRRDKPPIVPEKVDPFGDEWLEKNKELFTQIETMRIETTKTGYEKELTLLEWKHSQERLAAKEQGLDLDLIYRKHSLERLKFDQQMDEKRDEKRKKREASRLAAMKDVMGEFTRNIVNEETQNYFKVWEWARKTREALGEEGMAKFGGMFNEVLRKMTEQKVGKPSAGKWQGIPDLYKQIQSAVLKPSTSIDMKQLNKLQEMSKYLESIDKKLDPLPPVGA